MLALFTGVFLGWSSGANDAANCFGTAVSSRMVSWRQAVLLAAPLVVVGAIVEGAAGLQTLTGLTRLSPTGAGLGALAAAATMAWLTWRRLPVSASQAVVGALVGRGLVAGELHPAGLGKILACWVGTPIGAMLVAGVLYYVLRWPLRLWRPSVFTLDPLLRLGLIACGCYGAYALGANNVANVASFLLAGGHLGALGAVTLGGLAMAGGILTFSRGVMLTVGRGITPLDGFSALVVVLAQALTVHFYAKLGVPVSATQAIVGAVLGLGLVKGVHILNLRALTRIVGGWLLAPVLAAVLGAGLALAIPT
jgi:PiT family inorganic phosphate transporter